MITVTVTGPGGCFDETFLIIKEALEARGHQVLIEDEHPSSHATLAEHDAAVAQWNEDFTRICAERGESHTKYMRGLPDSVRLVAEHCPWGG